MRILLIMDPGIPVPPLLYGGHERLVALFAREYTALGHAVTVLSGPDSSTAGTNVFFGVNDLKRSRFQRLREVAWVWRYLLRHQEDFDLVHNFGRLIYLAPVLRSPVKKIMTYGRRVAPGGIRTMVKFAPRNLLFTACSNDCVSTGHSAGHWATVYNAIDFSDYRLQETTRDDMPLMFLGRMDRIKGAHTAIAVARATGRKLLLAGNTPDTADNLQYFESEVAPLIDNQQIVYLGPLNDAQKNNYLGQAVALLFPIEWREPFGLVMIEAMACGTPVIGFATGSVPEVIDQGVTGMIVQDTAEMIAAIPIVARYDRAACRGKAEKRFDVSVIAARYLELAKSLGS